MDEILKQFNNTVGIDPENENKTLFEGLYKNWGKPGHQENRRKKLLESQKLCRNKNVDICRGVLEIVHKNGERTDAVQYCPNIFVPGFSSRAYRNVLMMSEWMVEKPEDFETNWYVVPCPKGIRSLVVASRGQTKCYTKHGNLRTICRTALPGGNPCDGYKNEQSVILDGIHVDSVNTMYILDILAWNVQPMSDGETEFRHFWLKNYLEEINDLQKLSKKNKMLFKILPKVECDKKSFNEFMMKTPHFDNYYPPLDGLLFYHKLTHYVAGQTPLVGWLYPYMVNEVFGPEITVHPEYMSQKPANYSNLSTFIQEFEEKAMRKKKWPYNRRANNRMDTSIEEGHNNTRRLNEATNPNDSTKSDDAETSKEMDTGVSLPNTSPDDPQNNNNSTTDDFETLKEMEMCVSSQSPNDSIKPVDTSTLKDETSKEMET